MARRSVCLFLGFCFSSCSVFYPSIMLRTGRNYPFTSIPSDQMLEYKIASNDMLSFHIYSNDGFKLIDLTSETNQDIYRISGSWQYLVEHDGLVKLPIIGRIPIAGYTLRQAELMLEEKYKEFYNKPFILLSVSNRRVIVFAGSGSDARIIKLENNNTNLIEALALAGGISQGKAKRVKVIRGNPKNPEVYLIDLSTINGMKQGNMVMQENDIIYVEPVFRFSRTLVAEMSPYITILTNVLLIISIISRP